MALQAPGGSPPTNPIKYSQIIAEFGTPTNGGLGQFRLDGGEDVGSLTNIPLDTGIPTTGQISFQDFYGKRLNHIVDFYSIGNNTTRQDAKVRWSNNNVHIVGSSKTGKARPSDTVDDRVIINVNNTIGSEKNTQTHVALKTGSWDSGTTLEIEIGISGKLFGAGGDGGAGGNKDGSDGTAGGTGSSALGIEYPCTVNNLGVIQSGYGGGGGGDGKTQTTGGGKKSGSVTNGSSGGGGGGGAGLPSGDAGTTPGDSEGSGSKGNAGGEGTETTSGTGGAGGTDAGDGGDGGVVNNTSTKAEDGGLINDAGEYQGGTGGDNGYAIITNQGSAPSVTGGGSLTGRTLTSTNPT